MLLNSVILAELAETNRGLITTDQVHGAHVSMDSVWRRVRAGTLKQVQPGVFGLVGAPLSWTTEVRAAVLSTAPDGLASFRTATGLWDLKSARRSIIELSLPRTRRANVRAVRLHRPASLPVYDRSSIDGIAVTNVRRTLIDVAGVVPFSRLAEMADDAVRRQLTSYEALHHRFVITARRGRPGTVAMRALLEQRIGCELDSTDFEGMVRKIVVGAALASPTSQLRIDVGDRVIYADFGWPQSHLIVECDGWKTHASPAELQYDLERQNLLVLDGWTILRFAWGTVVNSPTLVANQIRDALESALSDH